MHRRLTLRRVITSRDNKSRWFTHCSPMVSRLGVRDATNSLLTEEQHDGFIGVCGDGSCTNRYQQRIERTVIETLTSTDMTSSRPWPWSASPWEPRWVCCGSR